MRTLPWRNPRPAWRVAALLAGLALLAYARALSLPLISDDYVQIRLARQFGPASGWAELARDPLYRCRATSLLLTYWTECLFGMTPLAFSITSVMLHILNTWAVAALGIWRAVGWRISISAAAFFAVYQGHQEAVIWYAALPELLVFFFVILALLAWIQWNRGGASNPLWLAASLACYVLALFSKEPGVVLIPLLALVLAAGGAEWRRRAIWILPFALLGAAYFWLIYGARSQHLHFNDAGTFSLNAPFWIPWTRSYFRLFRIWGLVSVVVLAAVRPRRWLRVVRLGAVWIGVTLLPYSFITYMPHIPSRHTYLPSLGLSLIVAAASLTAAKRLAGRPRLAYALAALILVHQCGYIWTRKHHQFLERAEPTERVIRLAQETGGPIYIDCFPYDISVAQYAVELRVGPDIEVIKVEHDGRPPAGALNYCASTARRAAATP